MSEFEALTAEIDVAPIAGTGCSRPRKRNAGTAYANPRKCKTAGVVEAKAGAAACARCPELEALLHLDVGRSEQQQQQQQGEPRPQPGQRQPQQHIVSSLASGGRRVLETVARVVGMAGPDAARPFAGDVTGEDLKEMAAAAFRQFDAFKASLAATQALVAPLEAQLRALLEVQSRLEAGTLKAAQRKEQADKCLKVLVCRRRTRSLCAGFNAIRNFGAEAAVAQREEHLSRRDDGVGGTLHVALDAESKYKDRLIEMTARQAAVTATFRFMAMKALVRREQASSMRPAFDAMRKFSIEKSDTLPVLRTIGARNNEDAGQQQPSVEPNAAFTWDLYDMAMSFIDTPQLFIALFEFDASFLVARSLSGEIFRDLNGGSAREYIRTPVGSAADGKHHTGSGKPVERIAASIVTAVGEYLCDELRGRVFAQLRGVFRESFVRLAAMGARPCTSIWAPPATTNVTAHGEEKSNRLTLSKYLNVFEKGKRTEPGGEKDGVAVITPEMPSGLMRLSSAKLAFDTGVARTSESVLTEAATTKPDASQVESSERTEGIWKRSQVSSLVGVMDKVMEEWCNRKISDTLDYLKMYPSSGIVLSPEETAGLFGEDGKSEVLPDGAEAGECWNAEDEIRREHELKEIATIFGRLNGNDRLSFMIWFKSARKAFDTGAEAFERRKAAEARMKETGLDAKADSRDTRRKKMARKARRKNQGKKREATKGETKGGKKDNAPGFRFSSPGDGIMHKHKLPLKFARGVSLGAATNAVFVFGRDNTTETTWASSSPPERRLQNRNKKTGGQPWKIASAILRATLDAERSHRTSLIYAAHPILLPQTNVKLCDGVEDGSEWEEEDKLPCHGNEGEDGSESEEEGGGDGACSMTSVFSTYQY